MKFFQGIFVLRKFELSYLHALWIYFSCGLEGLLILLSQELNGLLAREKGFICLKNLQKKLRTRQQHMVSQVLLLYPVKISAGPREDQELESFSSSSRLGICYANSLTSCAAFSYFCYLRN